VWIQARNAKKRGVPILLSTVYCDVWQFDREARGGALGFVARHTGRDAFEALKAAGRALKANEWSPGSAQLFRRGFTAMQRDVLSASSLFLPNSDSEWERVRSDFSFFGADDRVVIVPNGVDLRGPTSVQPQALREAERYRGCILCVARIEGRKNQLALIEAAATTGLHLVLAGKPSTNQPGYVAAVRDAAEKAGNVSLLGSVSEELKQALYAVAAVHALPSWIETTGLSTLEAAIHDCRVVVSPNGDTRDYFGNDAEYCNPADVDDIREALLRAASREAPLALKKRIAEQYTWYSAAKATSAAYDRLLAGA
jgi:glycosyltransferase involved in cell wall biosynthesis